MIVDPLPPCGTRFQNDFSWARWSECERKQKRTKNGAWARAYILRQRSGDDNVVPYQCRWANPFQPHWHVGHDWDLVEQTA